MLLDFVVAQIDEAEAINDAGRPQVILYAGSGEVRTIRSSPIWHGRVALTCANQDSPCLENKNSWGIGKEHGSSVCLRLNGCRSEAT